MVLSICVILPLNFQGTLFADVTSFEHTTLANLDPSGELLWVHLVLAFIFFPVAILVMRRFSVDVRYYRLSIFVIISTVVTHRLGRKNHRLGHHFS